MWLARQLAFPQAIIAVFALTIFSAVLLVVVVVVVGRWLVCTTVDQQQSQSLRDGCMDCFLAGQETHQHMLYSKCAMQKLLDLLIQLL